MDGIIGDNEDERMGEWKNLVQREREKEREREREEVRGKGS